MAWVCLIELCYLPYTDCSIGTRREQMTTAGQLQVIDAADLRMEKSSTRMFTVETVNQFTAMQAPHLQDSDEDDGRWMLILYFDVSFR